VKDNHGFQKWIASYVHAAIRQTADNCFRSGIQAPLSLDAGINANRDDMKEC
jgi:hypothetical protein